MSDVIQCLHIKNLVQSFGPKVKFVQFYISPGRFGKVLCSSANEFQQNSNSIYSTNMDCFVIDSLCLHLTCLSFVTNSWNHLKYNYSIVQSALMTRQILHYHYGIFCRWVAEVPPCEPSLCSSKEWGNMAVFTSYTARNSSEMPGVCLGVDGRFWNWLALSKLISPPLSDIVRLPFQGGKLLSLVLF